MEEEIVKEKRFLTYEEAESFFSELYGGFHHVPNKIKIHGNGYSVLCHKGTWATYDFDMLTKFVLMCHKYCYRGEINPRTFRHLRISIWKRQREGSMFDRHPTIEDAMEKFNTKK